MDLKTIESFIAAQIANGNAAKSLAIVQADVAAFKASEHASNPATVAAVESAVQATLMAFFPELDPLVIAVRAAIDGVVKLATLPATGSVDAPCGDDGLPIA